MPPTVASEVSAQTVPQSTRLESKPAGHFWWLAGIVAALVALPAFLWVFIRSKARPQAPALITEYVEDGSQPGSFTMTVAPRSITGSAQSPASSEPASLVSIDNPKTTRTQSEVVPARVLNPGSRSHQHSANVSASLVVTLGQWLKQKLVRRLLADRAQLIATQQASTLKVMKVDERLARIEEQVHEQNRAYERRIEKLTEELNAAKEENRDLIRAQINKVKAEMEAARARLVSDSKDPAD
jgi:hypothetical protein